MSKSFIGYISAFLILLAVRPLLAQEKQEAFNASTGSSSAVSNTSQDWDQGIEALVPGNEGHFGRQNKGATDDFDGPRTLLSSGVSLGSNGSSLYQGLVGYRATKNLTLFSATQGGTLMALGSSGNVQSFGLSPLSSFGLAYDGLQWNGLNGGFNFSFTPALRQGISLPNSNLAGPAGLPGAGPSLSWGTDNGFSFGGSLTKDWGSGFQTNLSIQLSRNSPVFYNSYFFGSSLFPSASPFNTLR